MVAWWITINTVHHHHQFIIIVTIFTIIVLITIPTITRLQLVAGSELVGGWSGSKRHCMLGLGSFSSSTPPPFQTPVARKYSDFPFLLSSKHQLPEISNFLVCCSLNTTCYKKWLEMFIFVETVPFIASIVSWAAYDLSIFDYNRNDEVCMNKKQSDKQTTGFRCTM